MAWYVNNAGYVARSTYAGYGLERKLQVVLLHRLIASGIPRIDHHNGNKLDNRRQNLRPATHNQNMWNRNLDWDNTSGFKGVSFRADKKRKGHSTWWQARIVVNRRIHFLGYFSVPIEAAKAYDVAARKHFGRFARLNFPRRGEQGVT